MSGFQNVSNERNCASVVYALYYTIQQFGQSSEGRIRLTAPVFVFELLDSGLSKVRPLLIMFIALCLAIFDFKNHTQKIN